VSIIPGLDDVSGCSPEEFKRCVDASILRAKSRYPGWQEGTALNEEFWSEYDRRQRIADTLARSDWPEVVIEAAAEREGLSPAWEEQE
jgi:hypothetical protein